ncbi:MAG: class I SAM-dependent methyltransferase [Chitinophagaceae bacterium]|nr:MAG: class I SAM-dependent methyltransferase [Chitinophagaceae bacterium]
MAGQQNTPAKNDRLKAKRCLNLHMHFFDYTRYFFYLASNWNIRIATHIISKEIKGEKKYDIQTTGADELESLEDKGIDTEHATIYMPVSYDVIEDVFDQYNPAASKHLIDIGCGKGRAMCVAAQMGARKITGIDFSKEFCDQAKLNLLKSKQKCPALDYKVLNNDAFYFDIPEDVDCIFMFNPFDEVIMSGVLENIEVSLEEHPRKLTIIYANPMQKHLFLEAGFTQTYHTKKMKYLEAIILEKPAKKNNQ